MAERFKRLAILHSRRASPGARHHMVSLIAEDLAALGVEIVHLYGTSAFEPADALLVHVDQSRVPKSVTRFAERYPRRINAGALDIRKQTFADGLLKRGDTYDAPVIVKSDLNYGGVPEYLGLSLVERAWAKAGRLVVPGPSIRILTKEDYRIFPRLADVPEGYFGRGNIVQKMLYERAGEKFVLREYLFLGNLHYENIEHSDTLIISEDQHISCMPFTPHPRLIEMRRKLNLDYGKIDYVMVDGAPFIFDANKTMGLGEKIGTDGFGDGLREMLRAFAGEIRRVLMHAEEGFSLPAPQSGATQPASLSAQSHRRAP